MNTTLIGNVSHPISRGNQYVASRGPTVAVSEPSGQESTHGLRRIVGHRPNQTHAMLTYGLTTLKRSGASGENIDIFV
jgi:hypothetical protein